jgi:hypothetical protein
LSIELLEDRTLLSAVSFQNPVSYGVGSLPTSVAVGDFGGNGRLDLAVTNRASGTISVLLGNGDGTFQAATTYNVGTNPVFVATADFNHDGKLDLAVANQGSGNVSILLGNGDGTFQAASNYNVGVNPTALAVADFNHDGSLDLAVANQGSGNVSVLLGNGDGTFRTAVNYQAGPSPDSIVVVPDFANGGDLDLAVANNELGGTVSVLQGNGDGTFQAPVSYAVGSTPSSLVLFNAGGQSDLAVVNHDSNTVSVLLNNGDGTFKTAVNYQVGSSPVSVATGDVNVDGKSDLLVANQGDDTVSVLTGNGDGTFQTATSFAAGASPSALAVGDFNRDGESDLAVVNNQASGTVSVLLNATSLGRSGFFETADAHLAASSPFAVAVGDFNGDSHQDLAVANQSSNNVSVLLGNGDGTFQAAKNYAAGAGPSSVAVGDFAGNGKLDLVVANRPSGTISVLMGNGDGTFQAPTSYSVGTNPVYVVVGDFNGDHKLDLAVANQGSGTVSVLLGNGDGTFQSAVSYSAGTNPFALTAGDFAGNGKLDLAVANEGSANISVLLGNGDGSFQTATNYAVGSLPAAIAVGDFGGNGKLDLAVTNAGSGNVSVLLGNGDGTFQAAVNYAVGAFPDGVAVADLNRDGKADLAVANQSSGTVSVLLGNGDGTFQTAVSYGAGASPNSIAVADFNGDGQPDITVADRGGTVAVLLGNGHGTFLAAANQPPGYQPTAVAVGDINGDGNPDLVVANQGSNNVSLLLSNGDGTFQPTRNYAVGTNPVAVAIGDFAGNGNLDLAVANKISGTVTVLLGDGFGNFQAPVNYTVGNHPDAVAVGDFDGDGKPDIVAVNQADGAVSVLLGNGDGTFKAAVTYAVGSNPSSIAVGDFAHNGKLDLVVANQSGSNVSVLMGNGDGTFQAAVNYAAGTGPSSVAVGDFNGDGKLDLAVADQSTGTVSILLGNGDGTFGAARSFAVGPNPGSVAVADLNRDGKLDLAVTNQTGGTVSVLFGNGDGTFQTATAYVAGTRPTSVAVGDFTVDGKPDLAVTNQSSGTVSVLTNQAAVAVSLSSSLSSPVYGQPLTFTAILGVTTPGAGLPTGTVQFQSDGTNLGPPVAISTNGGVTSASLSISSLGAGTHTIQAIYSGDDTFAVSSDSQSQVINQAATSTTVVSSASSTTYGQQVDFTATVSVTPPGGNTPTGTVQFVVDGVNFGSPVGLILNNGTLTATSATTSSLGAGLHTVQAVYQGDSNFITSTATLSGGQSVSPAPLTITADNQSMVYGAALPTLTASYQGFVNGDTSANLTAQPILSTVPASSHVGSYTISVSGAVDANYSITYASGTLTISSAPLTIAADGQSMLYGGTLPILTATFTGLVNGDTPATFNSSPNTAPVLSTVPATSHAGTYSITVSGASDADYSITFASGVLVIAPASLTITADSQSMIYGGTLPTLTASYTGLVNGDTPATFNSSPNTPPTLSTVPATSNAGSYAITVSGAADSDYSITFANGTLTINRAPLTITAASDTKAYDGTTNSSATPTATGLQGSDTVTGLSQAFASKNVLGTDGSTLVVAGYTINDGNGGANYSVTLQSASGTITSVPLTIAASSDTKVYDGATDTVPTQTPVVQGTLYGTDTVTGLSEAFTSKNVGTTEIVVTGYTINDGNGGNNYSVTLAQGSGTITSAPLTITAASDTKSYDGTTNSLATPVVAGLQGADTVTGLSQAFSSKNVLGTNGSTLVVGGYTINDGNGGANYSVTLQIASGTVTAAPLTITAASDTKTYDGTTNSSATPTVAGLQGTDTVTGLSQAFSSKNVLGTNGSTLVAAGYTINDGNGGANYTVTLQSTSGTITPAPLTITAASGTKVYDSTTNSSATPTAAGLQGTDTAAGLSQAFSSKNVLGTNGSTLVVAGYTINDGNGGANYTVTLQSGSGTITPASLTITAASDTKTYDGTTNSSATPGVAGLQGTDTITGLAEAYADVHAGTDKTLNVSGHVINDGNAGNNYSVTLVSNTTGVINPASLTITADNQTMSYGGALPALTASYQGFVNGDTSASLTTLPTLSTVPANSHAGSYTITPSGAVDPDYAISYKIGTLTITPVSLTITADGQSMLYGGTPPILTATFTGLVNGDTPDTFNSSPNTAPVFSTVPATSHAGTYAITVSGASDPDYTIAFANGTLVIAPATLTISANNETMVYGGVMPALAVNYAGLVNGDKPATFSVKPNTPPSVVTVPATSHAGSYAITVSGAADSDYSITFVNGTLTITPAPLTITADNQSMLYGGTLPTLTASYSGLVDGDTPATFNASPNTAPVLATVPATSPVGSYAITVSKAADADYNITFSSGTLTITPAPLTIRADNQSMVFGSAVPALTASYQAFVNGDTSASLTTAVTLTTTATSASPAGSYPITPGGATDPNYTITFVSGTLTVAQASTSLTVSSSIGNPVFGQQVTLTVVLGVTPLGSGTPTGTVQFQVNGKNFADPVAVSSSGGTTTAVQSTTALPIGRLTITAVYSGDKNFIGSQANTSVVSGTQNQRFLNQLYLDLLGRTVDSFGLGTWTAALSQGATRTAIAQAIEASPEYLTDVVQGYYRAYLHRDAEPAGLNGWVASLEAGATKEQVKAAIIGSPEYFQNRGGGTTNGYLSALYQDGLGRAIDPTGQSTFSAALAAGATPGQVAAAIFASDEYRQDLIQTDFTAFLHRSVDSFGLTSFLNALRGGATDQDLAAAILGSGEYFSDV